MTHGLSFLAYNNVISVKAFALKYRVGFSILPTYSIRIYSDIVDYLFHLGFIHLWSSMFNEKPNFGLIHKKVLFAKVDLSAVSHLVTL